MNEFCLQIKKIIIMTKLRKEYLKEEEVEKSLASLAWNVDEYLKDFRHAYDKKVTHQI